MRPGINHIVAATLAAGLAAVAAQAAGPLGNSFTYQGRLLDNGAPAGPVSISCTLWDDAAAGNLIASLPATAVAPDADGLFTIDLDFGAAWDGSERWLEIDVDGTTLSPRQELTAAPYASFALNAPFQKSGSSVYYNDGFVGVGRSSITTGAEVFGLHKETSSYGGMYITTADGGLPFYGYKAGSAGSMWTYADGTQWRVYNNGVQMSVESNGDVGIGTTSPAARLHVSNLSERVAQLNQTSSTTLESAVVIDTASPNNIALGINAAGTGLDITADGTGVRVNTGGSTAGFFTSFSGDGLSGQAVQSGTGVAGITGSGIGVEAIANSTSGLPFLANRPTSGSNVNIAIFRATGVNRARIDGNGRGFFNGGTQSSGADVAEAFEVEGDVTDYEPGDVLAISVTSDRTVTLSQEPYSTLVAGVHATKPGVLLTERDIDESLEDTVPMGVVGVIPTKVSAENGPIRRGDLLVSASLPGHAMKGTDRQRMIGAVVGKALENFPSDGDGTGTGVIKVMVSVK